MLGRLWRQVRRDPTGALITLLIGFCGALGLLLLLDVLASPFTDASPVASLAGHLWGD